MMIFLQIARPLVPPFSSYVISDKHAWKLLIDYFVNRHEFNIYITGIFLVLNVTITTDWQSLACYLVFSLTITNERIRDNSYRDS